MFYCRDLSKELRKVEGKFFFFLWKAYKLEFSFSLLPHPLPRMRYVLSCFSCVQLFATLWTVACQTPLSMRFSKQEYWSGLLCPPGNLPSSRIKPTNPALQADPLLLSHWGSPYPLPSVNKSVRSEWGIHVNPWLTHVNV